MANSVEEEFYVENPSDLEIEVKTALKALGRNNSPR